MWLHLRVGRAAEPGTACLRLKRRLPAVQTFSTPSLDLSPPPVVDPKKATPVKRKKNKYYVTQYHLDHVEYKKEMTATRKRFMEDLKELHDENERTRLAKEVKDRLEWAERRRAKLEKQELNRQRVERDRETARRRREARWEMLRKEEEAMEARRTMMHNRLLNALEREAQHWIAAPQDIETKITDDLWLRPTSTAKTSPYASGLPGAHYMRWIARSNLDESWVFDPNVPDYAHNIRQRVGAKQEEAAIAKKMWEQLQRDPNDTKGIELEMDVLMQAVRAADENPLANVNATYNDEAPDAEPSWEVERVIRRRDDATEAKARREFTDHMVEERRADILLAQHDARERDERRQLARQRGEANLPHIGGDSIDLSKLLGGERVDLSSLLGGGKGERVDLSTLLTPLAGSDSSKPDNGGNEQAGGLPSPEESQPQDGAARGASRLPGLSAGDEHDSAAKLLREASRDTPPTKEGPDGNVDGSSGKRASDGDETDKK